MQSHLSTPLDWRVSDVYDGSMDSYPLLQEQDEPEEVDAILIMEDISYPDDEENKDALVPLIESADRASKIAVNEAGFD